MNMLTRAAGKIRTLFSGGKTGQIRRFHAARIDNTTANWMDPLAAAATYQEYGTTNIVGDIVTFDDTG